jgi:hypothetical protein
MTWIAKWRNQFGSILEITHNVSMADRQVPPRSQIKKDRIAKAARLIRRSMDLIASLSALSQGARGWRRSGFTQAIGEIPVQAWT